MFIPLGFPPITRHLAANGTAKENKLVSKRIKVRPQEDSRNQTTVVQTGKGIYTLNYVNKKK